MTNSVLISIIVPVYNTENYIGECIESLINQSYSNIEIIIVNDGSTDNSTKIINDYQARDKRIIVIHQQNQGVSEARNCAIKQCTGEYILFVDSDDWIELNTCEVLLKKASESNADIVLCSYIREFENGIKQIRYILPEEKIYTENESVRLRRRLFGLTGNELSDPSQADTLGTVYAKLYRSEIIKSKNIEFVSLKIIGTAEDVLYNICYFEFVKQVYYINKHFYHYRKNTNSSITTRFKPGLNDQRNEFFKILNKKIESEGLDRSFHLALNNRIALSIFGLGLNILSSDYSVKRKIDEIKKILSTPYYLNAYSQLSFKYFPLHWKVFFFFAKHQRGIGVYLLLKVIQKIIQR